MTKSIALVSPGRTSSGGSAFSANLARELELITGRPVPQGNVPPNGRGELTSDVLDCDVVVNLGARVIGSGKVDIFWPLNVAPLDHGLDILPHTSPRNRARHLMLRTRFRQSVNRSHGLVFGSHYARTLYMAKYSKGSQLPYRVILGGSPSIEVFQNRPPTDAGPLILVCSHLYPYKGILEFIDALALAREELPDGTRVRIAGAERDAKYSAEVHRRIRASGLMDMVVVASASADELRSLYQDATLCVFPSTCENAGSFSLFDGLHAGAATLSSDRSSMPEVTRGATALCNPFDTDQFAGALVDLLTTESSLHDLRERARAWSAQAPTWRSRAEDLFRFVDEVAR
ncbi:glycosyltransferase [Janibacter sp. G349]|uniref:glycosyltransferase n=1 Tax=Janibacter sp. G349 TaxID=3405424 RepID=UPI003B82A398